MIIDELDKRLPETRLSNDISVTLKALAPYKSEITAVAVESTFNAGVSGLAIFARASVYARDLLITLVTAGGAHGSRGVWFRVCS